MDEPDLDIQQITPATRVENRQQTIGTVKRLKICLINP
jgi:hypothetical protein